MASQPPASPPTPTCVTDLSGDLLRAIFLRLPSLPSLVQTASACPAFRRAVRSSLTFRRSFRELHAPPVLAFSAKHMKVIPTTPSPWGRSDPDILAADIFEFSLTRHGDGRSPGWEIDTLDPNHIGFVAVANRNAKGFAAYNSLTQVLQIYANCTQLLEFHTLACEYDPGSSRVVYVRYADYWARASVAVLSSRIMQWHVFPETETLLPHKGLGTSMIGTVLQGFVCWARRRGDYILMLDTGTFQFSLMDLPTPLYASIKVCQTKDEKLCIVHMDATTLVSWLWTADDGCLNGRWRMYKIFPLHPIIKEVTKYSVEEEYVSALLVAAIDGFVYMSIFYRKDKKTCELFLSLCLETAGTNKLFKDAFCYYNEEYQPYVMAWPPSLVQSKEAPETEVVTGDNVADGSPVQTQETSSILVTTLQSFKYTPINDGKGILLYDKGSLVSKITTLDAQWTIARDHILRTTE